VTLPNKSIFLKASLSLFIVCLLPPAFYTSGINPTAWSIGLGLLFIGWIGDISWYANPLIFIAWIFYKYKIYIISLAFSFLATSFALSFLTTESLVVSTAPHYADIVRYGLGYYLWILSMVSSIIASLLGVLEHK
jgi:hypothetical protein